MRIPDRFCIMLCGDKAKIFQREHILPGIAHRLGQLVTYQGEIPDDFLRPWGITLHVDEDMDQGDDTDISASSG